jgi:LacI family transcriptional regulator
MAKKPTIHTIATMAGVCSGTVSRVIHAKDKVHPETRQRILGAIAKTGYGRDAMVRGVAPQRSRNILLGLHNIADPYCSTVAQVIGSQCQQLGYGLLLGDWNYETTVEAEYLQRIGSGNCDGLMVSPLPGRRNVRHYAQLAKARFPVVVIDNPVPTVPFNTVKYDDVAIARLATDYLFEKGHRRIVFLGERSAFGTGKDRQRGYVESHKAAGVPVNSEYLVMTPTLLARWDSSILERLVHRPEPPTAIIALNEMKAIACVNMLMRLGKRIPGDVAVVALGDVLDDVLVPVPLTAVAFRQEEAMRHALDLLVELIEHPELRDRPPRHYVQKPQLVVRQSA